MGKYSWESLRSFKIQDREPGPGWGQEKMAACGPSQISGGPQEGLGAVAGSSPATPGGSRGVWGPP